MTKSRYSSKFGALSISTALLAGLVAAPGTALASPGTVDTINDMFEQGTVSGEFGVLYYANHNAFFSAPEDERGTAAIGGELTYTTASLYGFSLRLGAAAQRNFARSSNGYNRDLGVDLATLQEAWLQWQGYGLRIRAGNQKLHAPFTGTYDYRIVPQIYQGVSLRYGSDANHVTVMRMYRYKSRISESYERTTNYNTEFSPFGPNTTEQTDGFWAIGATGNTRTGPMRLSGKAWYFNYKDYANMYFAQGKIAAAEGELKPFVALQYVRETDTGDALIGNIDSQTYGVRLGLKYHSLTATLNYDHIPHESGAYLNGALATPYAHNESSGPLFAQPFLTSTQDLGSGDAYSIEVKGAPFDNTFMGARYSYMDLTPVAGGDSIEQSEYLVYAIYNFDGALEGFSISDFLAYQTQANQDEPYWENRLAIKYSF